MATEVVEVYFEKLIRESDVAWLIRTAEDTEIWLPKSECELDEDELRAEIPEWLAIKKGLV